MPGQDPEVIDVETDLEGIKKALSRSGWEVQMIEYIGLDSFDVWSDEEALLKAPERRAEGEVVLNIKGPRWALVGPVLLLASDENGYSIGLPVSVLPMIQAMLKEIALNDADYTDAEMQGILNPIFKDPKPLS